MRTIAKYTEHFLDQTIYLLPYLFMGVSFLAVILPKCDIRFDFITWGNLGGFSIVCDVLFIKVFFFNKRYCWLTRHLPFSMLFISIINIIANEYYPRQYEVYGQIYEVIIFSLTLFIFFILCIEKSIKK